MRAPRNQHLERKLTRFSRIVGFAGANLMSAGDGRHGAGNPGPSAARQTAGLQNRFARASAKTAGGPCSVLRNFKTIFANKKPLRCSSRRLWSGPVQKSAERCAKRTSQPMSRTGKLTRFSRNDWICGSKSVVCRRAGDCAPEWHGRTDHRRNGGRGQARKRVEAPRHSVPSRTSPAARVIAESFPGIHPPFSLFLSFACGHPTWAVHTKIPARPPPSDKMFLKNNSNNSKNNSRQIALRPPREPAFVGFVCHPVPGHALRIQGNKSCPTLSCLSSFQKVVFCCLPSCPGLFPGFQAERWRSPRNNRSLFSSPPGKSRACT